MNPLQVLRVRIDDWSCGWDEAVQFNRHDLLTLDLLFRLRREAEDCPTRTAGRSVNFGAGGWTAISVGWEAAR